MELHVLTQFPDWLSKSLPAEARHPGLAIARYGDERSFGRGGFALSSPAFSDSGELDPCFTADEEDAVAPPMEWTAPPPIAQELVIIVEDGSSKHEVPMCHWLVWGLPGQKGKLLEGEAPPRTGKNARGNSEWLLPQPPEDDEAHAYVFQIFAIDLPLTLMPGASREDIYAALDGHVVACAAVTGTYARAEDDGDEGDWDEEDFA